MSSQFKFSVLDINIVHITQQTLPMSSLEQFHWGVIVYNSFIIFKAVSFSN